MNEDNFIISDMQCHQIAYIIYLDIANYIKQHQEEYNSWLKVIKEEKI